MEQIAHLSSLFDLLLSHRVLSPGWKDAETSCQTRLAELRDSYLDSLSHCQVVPVEQFLVGHDCSYSTVTQTLSACIADPILGEVSIFRQYQHAFTRELSDIIRQWKQNNTYIGSLASDLLRIQKYELPNAIDRNADLERKRAGIQCCLEGCHRHIGKCKTAIKSKCDTFGIDVKSISVLDRELEKMVSDVIAALSEAEVVIAGAQFGICWDYYRAFVHLNDPSRLPHVERLDDIGKMNSFDFIQRIRSGNGKYSASKHVSDQTDKSDVLMSEQNSTRASGALAWDIWLAFLHEVSELNSFFEMRLLELDESGFTSFSTSDISSNTSAVLSIVNVSAEQIADMKKVVIDLLDLVKYDKANNLFSNSSKNGIDNIKLCFAEYLDLEDKLQDECRSLETNLNYLNFEIQEQIKSTDMLKFHSLSQAKAIEEALEAFLEKGVVKLKIDSMMH